MQKHSFLGLVALTFAATILLLSGCKGGAVSKPQGAQVAAVPERPPTKPTAPATHSSVPQRPAIGVQQGGARQSATLNLRNIVSTYAGKAGIAGSADGSVTRATFDSPKGIATDGNNLYVADLNNHTIRKIDIVSGIVSTIAGMAGKKGSSDGKGAAARFNRPYGVTTDGSSLYVTDSNNHSVRQIELESGEVTTIAGGVGEVGYADGAGAQARFFIPEGITTDGTNLYVSDTHNHSIRKIELESGAVSTLAGLSGAPGYLDDQGTKARFSYPKGITTDGRNLFVVDFGNHRIRRIVIASGLVTTLAGGGENVDGAYIEHAEDARFNYPTGIATDGRHLYVVDTFNRTVRKIVNSSGAVATIAGTADLEGSTDAMGPDARFKDPVGITTDGSTLFVTDSGNHTVRKIR